MKEKEPSNTFNVKRYPGYELLSPKEIDLCQTLELYPKRYLEAKTTLIQESFKVGIFGSKPNSEAIVQIDIEKRDNVIEFMLKSGWIPKGARLSSGKNTSSTITGLK